MQREIECVELREDKARAARSTSLELVLRVERISGHGVRLGGVKRYLHPRPSRRGPGPLAQAAADVVGGLQVRQTG